MTRLTKKQKLAILHGMRSRLARRGGWIKGDFRRVKSHGTVGFCLAGAALDAYYETTGSTTLGPRPYDEIVKALSIDTLAKARLSGKKLDAVENEGQIATYYFNDARSTKKADVLALVDEKIAELEAATA